MKLAERILEYTASNKSPKETSKTNGHHHQYRVDLAGSGMTTFTIGESDEHFHEIKEGVVIEKDGHDHAIELKENSVEVERSKGREVKSFKTKYGFEHWFNKTGARDKDACREPVEVEGKRYSTAEQAAKDLLRRQ